MGHLWLKSLTICLWVVMTQVQVGSSYLCRKCDRYVVFGTDSDVPSCRNAMPCTEKESLMSNGFILNLDKDSKKCDRIGKFPNLKSPEKYYVCSIKGNSYFKWREHKCPVGRTFDPWTLRCITAEDKSYLKLAMEHVTLIHFYLPKCDRPGIFGHTDDCKLYHRCDDFLKPTEYSCPWGTYFDPNLKNCTNTLTDDCKIKLKLLYKTRKVQGNEIYWWVKYLESEEVQSSLVTSKKSDKSNPLAKTLRYNSAKPKLPTSAEISKKVKKFVLCLEKGDRAADPNNCSNYYLCDPDPNSPGEFIPLHKTCEKGTWFSTVTKDCVTQRPKECNGHKL